MKRFQITVNGNAYDVQVEEMGGAAAFCAGRCSGSVCPCPCGGTRTCCRSGTCGGTRPAAPVAAGAETINAPMPGNIVNVMVKAGDTVAKGQVLLVLEAMKMENEIMSPRDGVVAGVHVSKGESVDSGKLLVSLQ